MNIYVHWIAHKKFHLFAAELPNGVDVWWDGFTRVYIDVPPALYGKTMVNSFVVLNFHIVIL